MYTRFAKKKKKKSEERISKVLTEQPLQKTKNIAQTPQSDQSPQNPFMYNKNSKQRTYRLSMTSPWRLAYGLF